MLSQMIQSNQLSMDPDTGAIYRNTWTPIEDGEVEWAGYERVTRDTLIPTEADDFEYLRDLFQDGQHNTINDF